MTTLMTLRLVPQAPFDCQPVVKWAGGKRWYVRRHGRTVFDWVVARRGRLVEPFLGGAAMALYCGLPNMQLSDRDDELIQAYLTIRSQPEQVWTLLDLMVSPGIDRALYNRVREHECKTAIERAARTIFLNRCGFNGLYRKNRKGLFNVPFGGPALMPTRDHLNAVASALRQANLQACDFSCAISRAEPGDLIYADPPYHGGFVQYTSHGFDDAQQERLAKMLRDAYRRGVAVLAHNADTPLVRDLYAWAESDLVCEKRVIAAKGSARTQVRCLLMRAFPA
jgi:DNA adenine methylase